MPVYEDKERGTWYYKCSYKNWQGEQKQKLKRGFKTKREAATAEREFLVKIKGLPTMTFENLCELYLANIKSIVKESTYKSKETILRLHISKHFKDKPINSIKPDDIRKWQTEILGQQTTKQEKPISEASKKLYCVTLSAVFSYAVKYHELEKNPCKLAGSIGNSKRANMVIWNVEQYNTFISHLSACCRFYSFEFYKALFDTLFFTGIRIGECLALTIGDYDKDNKSLVINKTRLRSGRIQPTPKTDKSNRTVSLPLKLCSELEKHINALQDNESESLLFPVSHSAVGDILTSGAKAAALPRIRVHDLRHSHASMLINSNVQPLAISARLGHENIQTTLDVYSHLYQKTLDTVADLINDKMS